MAIVITMAGKSQRFKNEGYLLPKYALPVGSSTLFEFAVSSFEKYFEEDLFIFVSLNDGFSESFIYDSVSKLGISNYRIVSLNVETRGQAETLYLALERWQEDFPIYVFNIDTIRKRFVKPENASEIDGLLEVFSGEGDSWSFVESGPNNTVLRTTEKERISNLCSNGLYYFTSHRIFSEFFKECLAQGKKVKGEYYIAPVYNELIRAGLDIRYREVPMESLIFAGVPSEYEDLIKKGGFQSNVLS